MRTLIIAAILAAATNACFAPEITNGIMCDQSGLCPRGLTCQSDGVCRTGPEDPPDPPPGAAVLDSLALSAPALLDPPFAPGVFDYNLEVSLLVQSLAVIAEPIEGAAVTLDGAELDPLAFSSRIALPTGLTTISLEVTGPDLTPTTYTIDVSRSTEIGQGAYAKASNTGTTFDDYGYDVALSGDLMAVGAPFEDSNAVGINGDEDNDGASASGAVYVVARSGRAWTQEAYVKASNTGTSDQFGISIALDGDTLVVGASGEDSSATGINGDENLDDASAAGAVYVFRRTGNEWAQEAYIKASNTGANDGFGRRVAISGDTLVVGATGEDSSATGVNGDEDLEDAGASGAVYVFRRDGTEWAQEAYVKASNTAASDFFGTSVAISGDLLAVGATGEDSSATDINGDQTNNEATSSGAVYLFRRSGTAWAQEAYVKASNTAASDFFGRAVALDGGRLVVGANGEDSDATGIDGDQASNAALSSGAAYAFSFDAGLGVWQQDAYLKPSNTDGGDTFGDNVAIVGELIAVSADGEDSASPGINGGENNNEASLSGALYLFRAEAAGWRQIAYVKSSHPEASDLFGFAMALSADTLIGGAIGEDGDGTGTGGDPTNNDVASAGAVYIYY
jgi:hypothetical protein